MPDFLCPRCRNVLSHVNYSLSGYENGTVELENNINEEGARCDDASWEADDFDGDGDYAFFCPDCHIELDLSSLRTFEEDEEEDEEGPSSLADRGGSFISAPGAVLTQKKPRIGFCKVCLELRLDEELTEGVCEFCS